MVDQNALLIFGIEGVTGAVPVGYVSEILRPLPLEPIQGLPGFVLGLSVLRGQPVPVVDTSFLIRKRSLVAASRWIALRVDGRQIALAVSAVLGVRSIHVGSFEALPPLLDKTAPDFLDSVGTLDSQLLLVLQAARILTEEVWQALSSRGLAS